MNNTIMKYMISSWAIAVVYVAITVAFGFLEVDFRLTNTISSELLLTFFYMFLVVVFLLIHFKDAFLKYAIYSLNLAILVCIAYSYFIFTEWHQGNVTVFDAVLASAISTLIKVIPLVLIRSYLLRKYKNDHRLDPNLSNDL